MISADRTFLRQIGYLKTEDADEERTNEERARAASGVDLLPKNSDAAQLRTHSFECAANEYVWEDGSALYAVSCAFVNEDRTWVRRWTFKMKLKQLNDGLHLEVKRNLGPTVYAHYFADTPFAPRWGTARGIPQALTRLDAWLRRLAFAVNDQAFEEGILASLFRRLEARPRTGSGDRFGVDGGPMIVEGRRPQRLKRQWIFFVRHAESRWNAAQKDYNVVSMYKEQDHGISTKGREQAENLRKQIKAAAAAEASNPWVARFWCAGMIFTSPLTRAIQTAIIALKDVLASGTGELICIRAAREKRELGGADTSGVAMGDQIRTHVHSQLDKLYEAKLNYEVSPTPTGTTREEGQTAATPPASSPTQGEFRPPARGKQHEGKKEAGTGPRATAANGASSLKPDVASSVPGKGAVSSPSTAASTSDQGQISETEGLRLPNLPSKRATVRFADLDAVSTSTKSPDIDLASSEPDLAAMVASAPAELGGPALDLDGAENRVDDSAAATTAARPPIIARTALGTSESQDSLDSSASMGAPVCRNLAELQAAEVSASTKVPVADAVLKGGQRPTTDLKRNLKRTKTTELRLEKRKSLLDAFETISLDTSDVQEKWWDGIVETSADFKDRLEEFMEQLRSSDEETVIVVGHSLFFMAVFRTFLVQGHLPQSQWDFAKSLTKSKLPNCGVVGLYVNWTDDVVGKPVVKEVVPLFGTKLESHSNSKSSENRETPESTGMTATSTELVGRRMAVRSG